VSSKLDGLTSTVNQLLQLLGQNLRTEDTGKDNPEVVTNLESCVRSAGRFVSSAVKLVSARSEKGSQFGSELGDDLSDIQRLRIKDWIPNPPDGPSEHTTTGSPQGCRTSLPHNDFRLHNAEVTNPVRGDQPNPDVISIRNMDEARPGYAPKVEIGSFGVKLILDR
jgi:hypothetical protein